ncbi:MAG: hypothetical protein JNK15_24205, partial [Planctomycetes bacterium]|nr:hypothetical protein [Planctomycetota bacterium]
MLCRLVSCVVPWLVLADLAAQANAVPGLDGRLQSLAGLEALGRRGAAHPNGELGLSLAHSVCNVGSVPLPWQTAMTPNHPKVAFLLVRVANGRIEQISDASHVRHLATTYGGSGGCGTCVDPLTTALLGVHCSDAQAAWQNGDRSWLAPSSEVNPWLGSWNGVGGYFDRGDPSVGGTGAADGLRSLTSSMAAVFDDVKNRVVVKEPDLLTAGATWFYAAHLVHQGEALAARGDNLLSRRTTPAWNGSAWTFTDEVAAPIHGSILQRWPGAELNEGRNGDDDGRFVVGCVVTPLGNGQWHYEYALHNVDSDRGASTLRIPIDAAATASNFTFRDLDTLSFNNWPAARVGNELVWSPGILANPLNWNTIYNFGFDANVPPGSSGVTLTAARVGPGANTVEVASKAPVGTVWGSWRKVGIGCGGSACRTSVYESFANAGAFDLANTSWTLSYQNGAYTLGPGTGTWVPPTGVALASGDDTETATAVLPFTLPFPGGSTNRLWVGSNGYVSAASNGVEWIPNLPSLFGGAPRWAALWHDLAPAAGQILVDAQIGSVRISFVNVANYGGSGTATFQYQFLSNGTVHVLYQSVAASGNGYLVGYSPGNAAVDPGASDLSATLPTTFTLCAAAVPPLSLRAMVRPVLGNTLQLRTEAIPTSALAGVWILSSTQFVPGLDLGGIGMPGCTLHG